MAQSLEYNIQHIYLVFGIILAVMNSGKEGDITRFFVKRPGLVGLVAKLLCPDESIDQPQVIKMANKSQAFR